VRATNNAGDVQPMTPFWNPAAICATSSKPFASRRHEGNDHATQDSRSLIVTASLASPPLTQPPSATSFRRKTAAFKPGAGFDVVAGQLATACHSADYIKTQPRGRKIQEGFLGRRSLPR